MGNLMLNRTKSWERVFRWIFSTQLPPDPLSLVTDPLPVRALAFLLLQKGSVLLCPLPQTTLESPGQWDKNTNFDSRGSWGQKEIFQFPESFALGKWNLENRIFRALWKNKKQAPSPGWGSTLSCHTRLRAFLQKTHTEEETKNRSLGIRVSMSTVQEDPI